MKAVVDEDTCIACGLCVGTCETVFAFNDNGKAYSQVDVIPSECEEDAQTARDGCPVNAISIHDKTIGIRYSAKPPPGPVPKEASPCHPCRYFLNSSILLFKIPCIYAIVIP